MDNGKDETVMNEFERHVKAIHKAKAEAAEAVQKDYVAAISDDESVYVASDRAWGVRTAAKTMEGLVLQLRNKVLPEDLVSHNREFYSKKYEPIAMQKLDELAAKRAPVFGEALFLIIAEGPPYKWMYTIRQTTGSDFKLMICEEVARNEYNSRVHPSGSDD